MLAFWLGTLPALMLAGASAERLGRWKSNQLFRRIAGVIVIVIGIFALMPVRMLLR
jgi:sulfite exporter TauE/SafE